MKRMEGSHCIAYMLLWGLSSGLFASASNAADLDISYYENSNGCGDRSYDDTKNSTNQIDNDEEELDPSILETLF